MTQQEQDLQRPPVAQRPHGQLMRAVWWNGEEGGSGNLMGSGRVRVLPTLCYRLWPVKEPSQSQFLGGRTGLITVRANSCGRRPLPDTDLNLSAALSCLILMSVIEARYRYYPRYRKGTQAQRGPIIRPKSQLRLIPGVRDGARDCVLKNHLTGVK